MTPNLPGWLAWRAARDRRAPGWTRWPAGETLRPTAPPLPPPQPPAEPSDQPRFDMVRRYVKR